MTRRGFDRVRSFKSETEARQTEAKVRNGTLYRDFAADVFERLKRANCRMHGAPIVGCAALVDGRFAAEFAGKVGGVDWKRRITVNFPLLHEAKYLGDPFWITEAILKTCARFTAEGIGLERASEKVTLVRQESAAGQA